MTKKEQKKVLWLPIFATYVVILLYLFIYQKNDALPSGGSFDLLNDIERSKIGSEAFNGFINFPFYFSRWFDIFFVWLIGAYIVRVAIFSFKDFDKEVVSDENEKNVKNKWYYLTTGIIIGLFTGTILGVVTALFAWSAGFLMVGLVTIILIGLIVSVIAGLNHKSFGVGFAITYGIVANFIFAVFHLAAISIFLALLIGITVTGLNFVVALTMAELRLLFSRGSKEKEGVVS